MKLLLDQNISYRLVKNLETEFPGLQQIKRLGLENDTDKKIWEFAKKENFAILTFDSDFYDLSLLNGHPPKVIWLRIGNLSTDALGELLKSKADQIRAFLNDDSLSCLEILD